MFLIVLSGLLMAFADSVPGVSGGTVAFIMGVYDRFILSLNNVISKDKEKRNTAIKFLLKLGAGWITGMVAAVLIITAVFEKNIYEISSLFLGFVLFAIPIIIVEEKENFKGKYQNLIFLVLGIAFVAAITYFSGNSGYDSLAWGSFDFKTGIFLFVCGMLAISAMVLPGISGSTVLLVFGFYQAIMDAIHGFLKLKFEYLPALIIFGLGVIAGVLSTVKGLKIALEKARSATMYAIIGMMTGSLYAIVMGPSNLKDAPKPPMTFDTFNVMFFIIGGLVIIGLQILQFVLNKREEEVNE